MWVNVDKFKLFKAAVRLQGTTSLSDELNQFFDRRTQEIKGIVPVGDPNSVEAEAARRQAYETAKKRIFEMHLDIIKMIKFFKDQHYWTEYLGGFCKCVDYDKKFDPPTYAYGYDTEKGYEGYCISFIEEASDREADFKRETARLLLRNKDAEFVYDWVGFVEKLRERRKLGRQMLQFQMDALGQEQLSKLQEEERQREELDRLEEEAKRKIQEERERKMKEEGAEKRRQRAERKKVQAGGEKKPSGSLQKDEDEEEDEYTEGEDGEEEDDEEEFEGADEEKGADGTDDVAVEPLVPKAPESHAIVPVGENR
jgi:hypothetical protein